MGGYSHPADGGGGGVPPSSPTWVYTIQPDGGDVPHPADWDGGGGGGGGMPIQPDAGYPSQVSMSPGRWHSRASTCYAADCMPLSFTQKDFFLWNFNHPGQVTRSVQQLGENRNF